MAADDQQFCLRWNNHQSTLISVFDTLLVNGTLVDCTLAAEGQYLKAHKVVLSACSPYLEVLLSQHSEKHPIVILKDVTFVELKAMMDYMYRGEVNISQDQLGTFLKSAESLQIKGLTDNGTEAGDGRDVGSTAPKRQDPPPRKVPPATPPISQPRVQPTLPISSGLSIEHRRTSSQLCSDSPRDGSISPSLRKRRRIRRSSNGEDSNLTANDTSNSCDLPLQAQAQSTPLASNIVPSTPVTMPTPIVPPAANPKTEMQTFNRLDASNFNSVPPESGLLKEKIEPPSEPLLEPKTEYLDYLNNDNSVEDLTLDDDDDMDMSQPGPSHGGDPSQGFSQWHMSGDQTGTADEVFMAAQEAVNAQQRDSQDDHQYCLRWNNHQSTLISVFDTLLMNGTLVDCTLAAEGQYLNAHRVILSACSPYLEVLLSQHSEKHPIVMLKDVTFVELKAMVDYMYRGEVNVSQDQLGTFLKSAESLQIKGLSDNGTDRDNDRDVGSTAPRRQDPPPRKVPSTTPPILQPRAQPTLSVSSGFEHRRTSSQLCSDSPRNGSISPSLKKRKRIRRSSNGEDSNITANDTSNSCDLPLQAQAQSTPLASNIAPLTIATMPTPTVPPAANPTTEIQTFNRLDTSNFKTPSEPFLEPKTEYRDYLLDDNSVEDLTLDDDDDDIQPGPLYGSDPSQQGFSQWHMSGDQTGTADEVFMAAQEAVNAQQRDSQGRLKYSSLT